MIKEDTGIVMTTHTHPLLHSNKATIATTPLTLARVVATNTIEAFIETTVTMAAVLEEDMVDEGLLSQVHSTATTQNPQIVSLIVSIHNYISDL